MNQWTSRKDMEENEVPNRERNINYNCNHIVLKRADDDYDDPNDMNDKKNIHSVEMMNENNAKENMSILHDERETRRNETGEEDKQVYYEKREKLRKFSKPISMLYLNDFYERVKKNSIADGSTFNINKAGLNSTISIKDTNNSITCNLSVENIFAHEKKEENPNEEFFRKYNISTNRAEHIILHVENLKREEKEKCLTSKNRYHTYTCVPLERSRLRYSNSSSSSNNNNKRNHKCDQIIQRKEQYNSLKERRWNSNIDYMRSVLSYSLKLGIIWRFPYVCYSNGGGCFLFAYFICLIILGIPMFWLEISLGQKYQKSFIHCYKELCNKLIGIIISSILIIVLCVVYFYTISCWILLYLFKAFEFLYQWNSIGFSESDSGKRFFITRILNKSESLWDFSYNYTNVQLMFCAGIICIILVVVLLLEKEGNRFKNCFIARIHTFLKYRELILCTLLFILLIRAMTLEGSLKGIHYYLKIDMDKLFRGSVWVSAGSQIFYSLGIAWGELINYGSKNNEKNNFLKDSFLIISVNSGISFLTGLIVFSIIGFMSHISKMEIDKVGNFSLGFPLVTYAIAIKQMIPRIFFSDSSLVSSFPFYFFLSLFSFIFFYLFFGIFFVICVESLLAMLHLVLMTINDLCKSEEREVETKIKRRRRKKHITILVCFFLFLCNISLTLPIGSYIVEVMDMITGVATIYVLAFCEIFSLLVYYGIENFMKDIYYMTNIRLSRFFMYFYVCFLLVLLTVLVCVSIHGLFSLHPTYFLEGEEGASSISDDIGCSESSQCNQGICEGKTCICNQGWKGPYCEEAYYKMREIKVREPEKKMLNENEHEHEKEGTEPNDLAIHKVVPVEENILPFDLFDDTDTNYSTIPMNVYLTILGAFYENHNKQFLFKKEKTNENRIERLLSSPAVLSDEKNPNQLFLKDFYFKSFRYDSFIITPLLACPQNCGSHAGRGICWSEIFRKKHISSIQKLEFLKILLKTKPNEASDFLNEHDLDEELEEDRNNVNIHQINIVNEESFFTKNVRTNIIGESTFFAFEKNAVGNYSPSCLCNVEFHGKDCSSNRYISGYSSFFIFIGWIFVFITLLPIPIIFFFSRIRRWFVKLFKSESFDEGCLNICRTSRRLCGTLLKAQKREVVKMWKQRSKKTTMIHTLKAGNQKKERKKNKMRIGNSAKYFDSLSSKNMLFIKSSERKKWWKIKQRRNLWRNRKNRNGRSCKIVTIMKDELPNKSFTSLDFNIYKKSFEKRNRKYHKVEDGITNMNEMSWKETLESYVDIA